MEKRGGGVGGGGGGGGGARPKPGMSLEIESTQLYRARGWDDWAISNQINSPRFDSIWFNSVVTWYYNFESNFRNSFLC